MTDSPVGSDAWLLCDLIDRRPDLNAVALRPGQAIHAHALERFVNLARDLAACRTFEELADVHRDEYAKPFPLDELILRARDLTQ